MSSRAADPLLAAASNGNQQQGRGKLTLHDAIVSGIVPRWTKRPAS